MCSRREEFINPPLTILIIFHLFQDQTERVTTDHYNHFCIRSILDRVELIVANYFEFIAVFDCRTILLFSYRPTGDRMARLARLVLSQQW